jgi:hypothetical protein
MNFRISFYKKHLFCVFAICSATCLAQPIKGKWGISLSYGLALPTGAFGRQDVSPSVLSEVSNGVTYNNVIYFIRENNGYAESGKFISIKTDYQVSNHWFVALEGTHTENRVNTVSFFNDANRISGYKITSLTSDNYRFSAIAALAGYRFTFKSLNIYVAPVAGLATIASPSYNLLNTLDAYDWEFIDLTNSALLGFSTNIDFIAIGKLHLALKMDYNTANFNYRFKWKNVGLNRADPKADVINYRVFNLGLSARFQF